MELSPRMHDNALVSRTAAAASMVLLKNVNNTLPFLAAEGESLSVAVFGIGQIFTPVCSAGMHPFRTISILDGLCASETICPDGLLAHKYRSFALAHDSGEEMPLTNLSMEEFAENNAAALVVIARKPEDYQVQLTDSENAMLAAVTAAFSRTVLVLATPGWMELSEQAMACSAIVFMGIAGQEAGYALADLLRAKELPAGHLAHTWPLTAADAAAACETPDGFVGYRFYDTFGKDVRYPFGYGLSYGTYELGSVSVGLDGCDVTVAAEVVNTGETWPVSALVQVYVSYPETMTRQPVYLLDTYARTRVLNPGESQTLQLRFPVTELSVFHEDAHAYVLEAGCYDIRIGDSCRNTFLAGSIRVPRTAVVAAVQNVPMGQTAPRSRAGVNPFTYPGEAEELAAARKHAIRLSDRNMPRRSLKKGRAFTGCRADGNAHTLADVKRGWCNPFTFVASVDDHSLRQLVSEFGFCKASVPGALAASPALERYGVPAMELAAGSEGLYLQPEVQDEAGEIVRRQYCTAFPSASLLACSFSFDLIHAVGKAVGREMAEYGIDLWLAPGADLQQKPSAAFFEQWSEDPVVCGLCALALAGGVKPYGAAVLRGAALPQNSEISQSAFRDVYGLSFEIAASGCKACLLPEMTVAGQPLTENSALIRALLLDWKYTGIFFREGTAPETERSRVELEKSALRIVKLILESRKI